MSIRKFLGSLVPGFALVLILLLIFHKSAQEFDVAYHVAGGHALLYVGIVLASYLLGVFNIQISFRILDLLGGAMDCAVSRVRSRLLRSVLGFFVERLHVFSLRTLTEEARVCFPTEDPSTEKDEYDSPYWAAKMLVLDSSASLSKEAMEIEGDINFYAGMFLPLTLLAVMLLSDRNLVPGTAFHPVWPLSVGLLVMAVFFAVRFQHLRHDDIAFVAHAAEAIRQGKTKVAKVLVSE